MEQQAYLDKIHSNILIVMDEIDRICRLHSIKYYLCGGTLLGAVRHKGFIPWDDDLDIVMPRDDMNRFIEICKTELNSRFQLEWYGSKRGYYQYFPKVSLKDTLFEQEGVLDKFQSGIFVDIFPLDPSPKYSATLEQTKLNVRRIADVICSKHTPYKTLKNRIYKLISSILPKSFLLWVMNKELEKLRAKGETHYANFGSQYKLSKRTMPVEWYGEGENMQFEDRIYVAPKEYMKAIETVFGSNWNQLPPIEKRRSHYPKKVVFSDGSHIEFKAYDNKVAVEEQEKE